jgi:hypothetical protein
MQMIAKGNSSKLYVKKSQGQSKPAELQTNRNKLESCVTQGSGQKLKRLKIPY